jgi:predicted outer membrane repeat protein
MVLSQVSRIAIAGISIDGSAAAWDGGGILVDRPAGAITLDKVTVKNAKAGNLGGAILVTGGSANSSMTIADGKFEGDVADGNGGALAMQNISYPVSIANTLFKNNRAAQYGGALALDGKSSPSSRFVIDVGTQFFDNRSDRDYGGGALSVVFDEAHAAGAAALPLPATTRKLVFFNSSADLRNNSAGNGQDGQFIRVTNQDVDAFSPMAPLFRPALAPQVFLQPLGANKVLNFFIAYSMVPGHSAPWDRLKLNWETSTRDVYTW